MENEVTAGDSSLLHWCLEQSAIPHHKLAALCPRFLVISPPKTGSTWLAANLRCHPQLFIPDIKEVKYFSSFFKKLDFHWYLDNFRPGLGRMCGEASPSYALLPGERIRLVRRLLPEVKLIFLMRDPIARAWSHARHNHRYREANFGGCDQDFAGVRDEKWQENFAHDWPLASGDYLGQLRRWLSVFPREQMYVGFYETIAADPARLLREIFTFLGVDTKVDLAAFPLRERILAGTPGELSAVLQHSLHGLLHARTRDLVAFLKERFCLEPPPEWQATLAAPVMAVPSQPEAFRRDLDDTFVARLLAQEETFPSARCAVDEYQGYDVVYYRGMLYAFDQSLGLLPEEHAASREIQPPRGFTVSSWRANLRIEQTAPEQLRRYQDEGKCVTAPSLSELKSRVDHQRVRKLELLLQTTMRQTHERFAELEGRLAESETALRRVQSDLYPAPIFAAVCILRKVFRRVRAKLFPARRVPA